MHNLKDPEEQFHCSICNTTEHLRRLSETNTLTCSKDGTTCDIDKTRQLSWLRSVVKSEFLHSNINTCNKVKCFTVYTTNSYSTSLCIVHVPYNMVRCTIHN